MQIDCWAGEPQSQHVALFLMNGDELSDLDEKFRKDLHRIWPGEILWNAPMAAYTTLKVGGPASALVMPGSVDELAGLIRAMHERHISWLIIGRGSNILVSDAGFAGVLVVLDRNFGHIEVVGAETDGRVRVRVEAGCSLAKLVAFCGETGLAGLEFAAGIPGSVGGAVVMNAGAWNREIKDVVASVTCIGPDGSIEILARKDLDFGYRSWQNQQGRVAAVVECVLEKGNPVQIIEQCRTLVAERNLKQPKGAASAGSFFKNPESGPAAGRLIQDAGLKGYRIGGAEVSAVHANFIVNRSGATAADIIELMEYVQKKVHESFGIWLEPEVHIL